MEEKETIKALEILELKVKNNKESRALVKRLIEQIKALETMFFKDLKFPRSDEAIHYLAYARIKAVIRGLTPENSTSVLQDLCHQMDALYIEYEQVKERSKPVLSSTR